MDSFKKTKILGIIGNALIAVSVFLPVIANKLGSQTANLMELTKAHSDALNMGIWILLLAIANFVIIFADKLSEQIPVLGKIANQKLTLIPTIVGGILAFVAINSLMSIPGASLVVAFSFGFWTLIAGYAIALIYPFLYKGE